MAVCLAIIGKEKLCDNRNDITSDTEDDPNDAPAEMFSKFEAMENIISENSLCKKGMKQSNENSPLYIWIGNGRDELQLQYLAHTGLDVIQEKVSVGPKTPGDSRELYLGLLYASEEYKIYGYTTNTKIKFVVITDATNTSLRDNEIRMMFRHLHTMYTAVICNPFYIPGEQIKSQAFEKGVGSLVSGN